MSDATPGVSASTQSKKVWVKTKADSKRPGLAELIKAGMDSKKLNLSSTQKKKLQRVIGRVNKADKSLKRQIGRGLGTQTAINAYVTYLTTRIFPLHCNPYKNGTKPPRPDRGGLAKLIKAGMVSKDLNLSGTQKGKLRRVVSRVNKADKSIKALIGRGLGTQTAINAYVTYLLGTVYPLYCGWKQAFLPTINRVINKKGHKPGRKFAQVARGETTTIIIEGVHFPEVGDLVISFGKNSGISIIGNILRTADGKKLELTIKAHPRAKEGSRDVFVTHKKYTKLSAKKAGGLKVIAKSKPPSQCGDGIDNDKDGKIDSADPDCKRTGGKSESPPVRDRFDRCKKDPDLCKF